MGKFSFVGVCLLLCGCASMSLRAPDVIVLPEEMIYKVTAGTPVEVVLDGKPLTPTFAKDMNLVDPITLVRYEELLNNKTLKNIKLSKEKKQAFGVFGSILTILAVIFKMWRRKDKLKKLTLSAE